MRRALSLVSPVFAFAVLTIAAAGGVHADDCTAIAATNKTAFREARLSVRDSRLAVKSLNSALILRTAALEDENGGLRKLTGELQEAGGDIFHPPQPGTAHLLVQYRPLTLKVTVHHYDQLSLYDRQLTHFRLIGDYIRHYLEQMEAWKEQCPGMSVGNAWEWGGKQGESAGRAIRRTDRLIDLVEQRMDWLQRLAAWAQKTIPKAR